MVSRGVHKREKRRGDSMRQVQRAYTVRPEAAKAV